LRILFLGDVVGRSGRDAVVARLPGLRRELAADLVVLNAENASHGFGLAPDMARAFLEAGADVLTLGNHAWDRKEIIPYIEGEPRLIRPMNYPPGTPGRGATVVDVPGRRWAPTARCRPSWSISMPRRRARSWASAIPSMVG
jgi:calcineurin-like phosphoesterase